jgi:hypothetical protein
MHSFRLCSTSEYASVSACGGMRAGASSVPKLASEYCGDVSMHERRVSLQPYACMRDAAMSWALAASVDRSVVRSIDRMIGRFNFISSYMGLGLFP